MEERPAVEWGILAGGVLLILLGAAFVVLLPQDPVQFPQYLVRFVESSNDAAIPDTPMPEGSTDVAFNVTRGNLTRFEIVVELTDDQAASDPDHLRLELVSPDGQVVGSFVEGASALGRLDGATPPGYQAEPRVLALTVILQDRPSAAVVSAKDSSENREEVAARVADNATTGGAGTWQLRFTLEAGDCPVPDVDPRRSAACRANQPDGVDDGNVVRVLQLRSFHFDADIQVRAG